MTSWKNNFVYILFAFVAILVRNVASDIDDRPSDNENYIGQYYEPDNILAELLSDANEKPPRPVENRQWRSPDWLGEISGVTVDLLGNPTIFHRSDRTWEYNTFNEDGVYQEKYKGPITENAVLVLDPKTGEAIRGWGNHTFYLPHGIHADSFGDVWLTDVALHQVFKYHNSGTLRQVIGERFVPGDDLNHFCQPTSVAVAPTGEIVVADGYCNSRIVLFDPTGKPKYSIGEPWVHLNIPHSVTILPNREICIADREHGRMVCLNVSLDGGQHYLSKPYTIRYYWLGHVFAIAPYNDILYGVNGMTSSRIRATGFTMNLKSRRFVDFWGPETQPFVSPHDIAISPNNAALYVSEIGPNIVWKFDWI